MKKTLIALLSVTVVMLFAVSAFALHASPEMYEYTPSIVKSQKAQIELGGQIRIRGEYADNNGDLRDEDDGDFNDRKASFDQRVRLSTKATLSPNTFGMVELEIGDNDSDTYTWGCDNAKSSDDPEYDDRAGAVGTYQKGNCKVDSMFVRQAYISHQGKDLGMLSGWKAGHMLLGLGNGLFFDHTKFGDDAIVAWVSPRDGMEISLNLVKHHENNTAKNDDVTAYVATFTGPLGPVNFGADVTYLDDQDGLLGGKPLHLMNFGLRGDMAAGPANIYADVEIQSGKLEDVPVVGDVDLKGMAFMLGADFAAGPVNMNVEGAYGSGDDLDDDDESKAFITTLGSGQHYTYLYDQKVVTAAGDTNTGLTNTWYIKVGGDMKPAPDWKVSADLYYLQAVEEIDPVFDDKDIGVEVDAKVEYQIDTNLVYYIEGGYLFAGDMYKAITADNDSPDDPYSVRHGVLLKF